MRVLLFSNYFPPHSRGGYEQWCAEVAAALSLRGHEVQAITGRAPDEPDTSYREIPVHRLLHLEAEEGRWSTAYKYFFKRRNLEQNNLIQVERVIGRMQPNVAFIWGMWNVPRSVPAMVERLLPRRVAYYFCDYWPTLPSAYEQYWSTPSGRSATKALKRLVGQVALKELRRKPMPRLRLENCYCVSRFVCEKLLSSGIGMVRTQVIYGGTQIEEFDVAGETRVDRLPGRPLRLLYAGRLHQDKGVHTVIEAIGRLRPGDVSLTICGDDRSPYGESLRALVQENELSERVAFKGGIPRSEVPAIMAQHDVLVFPSIWEEPFARTVIEGMAAGLAVVGTPTGGTKEILTEGDTGLIFPPEDVGALAAQISRLLADAQLLYRIRDAGRQLVRKRFRFDQMVDALERELLSLTPCQ